MDINGANRTPDRVSIPSVCPLVCSPLALNDSRTSPFLYDHFFVKQLMADFTLVDPKGWEYDLHSVSQRRHRSVAIQYSSTDCQLQGLLCLYWLFPDV